MEVTSLLSVLHGFQVSALSYGAWVTFGTQVDVEQVSTARLFFSICKTYVWASLSNLDVHAGQEADDHLPKCWCQLVSPKMLL